MASAPFRFKKFLVNQEGAAHPVGTDSVLLGAWAGGSDARQALDIGTGTGVIALQLAQQHPDCSLDAIDIHPESVQCAADNFQQSPWPERLRAHTCALQDWSGKSQYDLIVSNPPFFTETTGSPDPARRAARSLTSLTLTDLTVAILRLLSPDGRCCVILPEKEGKMMCEYAATQQLYYTRITEVYPSHSKPVERLLLQFERNAMAISKNSIILRDQQGQYTDAYRRLTADFYLDF